MTCNIVKKSIFVVVFSLTFSFSFLFLAPSNAAAALIESSPGNCDCRNITNGCEKYCGNYGLNDIVMTGVKVTEILLALSGSVALLFFIYGGITFLISGGSAEKVSAGKQIITNSIIGLVIIFTSYIIIQFSMKAMGYDKTNFAEWNQSK